MRAALIWGAHFEVASYRFEKNNWISKFLSRCLKRGSKGELNPE